MPNQSATGGNLADEIGPARSKLIYTTEQLKRSRDELEGLHGEKLAFKSKWGTINTLSPSEQTKFRHRTIYVNARIEKVREEIERLKAEKQKLSERLANKSR